MDYFFMRMESAPNVQAISEESITCVKEDRHQYIMSSAALNLLDYREITLKSDTEPAKSRSGIVYPQCAKRTSPRRTQ